MGKAFFIIMETVTDEQITQSIKAIRQEARDQTTKLFEGQMVDLKAENERLKAENEHLKPLEPLVALMRQSNDEFDDRQYRIKNLQTNRNLHILALKWYPRLAQVAAKALETGKNVKKPATKLVEDVLVSLTNNSNPAYTELNNMLLRGDIVAVDE